MTRTDRILAGPWLGALCVLLLAAPASAQQAEGIPGAVFDTTRTIRVQILGMSCPFCAYGVEQKLKRLEGVEELDVDLAPGIATLTMEEDADVSNQKLKDTVDDAGFEAAAIVRSFESRFEDWNPGKIRRPAAAPEDTTPG